MTYAMMLVVALFMRFGPDIQFQRMLNRHLAERPVEFLLSYKRYHYILLVIAPLMLLLGGEAILLFGPELMLAYAADIAIYVDVVVIAAAATSWSSRLTKANDDDADRPADARFATAMQPYAMAA